MDVTIVAVSYNTAHLLKRMLTCVHNAASGLRVQTVVVDNNSTDDSIQVLKQNFPWVELIQNPENVGFGRANNQALTKARGRYVLLLNTDAFIEPHTLTSTIQYMDANPQVGVLGAKLVSEDGSLQPSCRYFPTPWNTFLSSTGLSRFFPRVKLVDDFSWDHASPKYCDWVPGCFYLIRREVIDQVGLFDPRYFLYFEEVDHCRAVKQAGWQVVYYPGTKVVHIGGESALSHGPLTPVARQVSSMQLESELLYYRKQHGLIGLSVVFGLRLLDDALKFARASLVHRDPARVKAARGRAANLIRLFIKTRLGSKPTR